MLKSEISEKSSLKSLDNLIIGKVGQLMITNLKRFLSEESSLTKNRNYQTSDRNF